MKYPSDSIGPQSQNELFAMLFTMLGNAYNCLAQYEREEEQRERERRMDVLSRLRDDSRGVVNESAESGGEFDVTAE